MSHIRCLSGIMTMYFFLRNKHNRCSINNSFSKLENHLQCGLKYHSIYNYATSAMWKKEHFCFIIFLRICIFFVRIYFSQNILANVHILNSLWTVFCISLSHLSIKLLIVVTNDVFLLKYSEISFSKIMYS